MELANYYNITTIPVVEPLFSFLCYLCYRITFILRPGNVSFKLSFLIPFLIINANQLRFFVVYCTSYNLIAVGQSRDYVYFEMWFLLLRSFLFIRIRILNGLISSSLSSYHEKATEALCVGRIQTRLGVAFASKFSA